MKEFSEDLYQLVVVLAGFRGPYRIVLVEAAMVKCCPLVMLFEGTTLVPLRLSLLLVQE